MERVKKNRILLKLLLCCSLYGCANKPGPQDGPFGACPATPAKVRDVCGCHPYEERSFNLLYQARISEDVKTKGQDCISASAAADGTKSNIKAQAEGCIRSESQLDDKYKEILISIVNKGLAGVTEKEIESWGSCRAAVTKKQQDKFVEIDFKEEKLVANQFSQSQFQVTQIDNKKGVAKFRVSTPCPAYINQNGNSRFDISEPKVDGNWCNYDAKMVDGYTDDGKAIDKLRLIPVFSEDKYLQNSADGKK